MRAAELPTVARACVLGLGVAAAVYVRPVGQVLVLLGLVRSTAPTAAAPGWPWLRRSPPACSCRSVRWRCTTRCAGTTSRSCAADPRRSSSDFVADRIVEPGNGPGSEELAAAVARELLPNEPYRSRGIDLETFFSSGSSRMHDDFTVLSDRTWGWDDDYRRLGRVAREAILAHPGTYARGVGRDVWRLLALAALRARAGRRRERTGTAHRAGHGAATDDGEPIPSSREAPYISTPDGRIREVWTSPTEDRAGLPRPGGRRPSRCARQGGGRAPRRPPDPRRPFERSSTS